MIIQRLFSFMALLSALALNSHAFEYRIISNLADSTLDGCEISLINDCDLRTEYFGVVENGIIDIKGESIRSFPATMRIRRYNPENHKDCILQLIVEAGTIVVDIDSIIPLYGGELIKEMKVWINRMLPH